MKSAKVTALYSQWDQLVDQYVTALRGKTPLHQGSGHDLAKEIATMLATILGVFTGGASSRDSWSDPPTWDATPHGVSIMVDSIKQQHEYTFGLYLGEFYLHTHILAPQHIKHMPDEFWDVFAECGKHGEFSFKQNAGLPDQGNGNGRRSSFREGRSSIYRMIRNAVLLEQHTEYVCDLGWFETTWPVTVPWDVLISTGSKSLNLLHRLNYMMYRCEHQKQKTRERRYLRSGSKE